MAKKGSLKVAPDIEGLVAQEEMNETAMQKLPCCVGGPAHENGCCATAHAS